MILHLGPDAPPLLRAAAAAALYAHIGGGTLGLVSGTIAAFAAKGEHLYRLAGNVFFVSMLVMSGIAAIVATFMPGGITNVSGGTLTFYLVATAWVTVIRKEGAVGAFEMIALVAALGVTAMLIGFGVFGVASPTGMTGKQAATGFYIFAALPAFAASMDLKAILNHGISGAQRIARHLWRMCVALLFAAGSFFTNGLSRVLPHSWNGSPLLFLPMLVPLGLLIYWMTRVRLTGWYGKSASAPA
jgi:hypothetical protein